MAYKTKTWNEKMNNGKPWKVVVTDKPFADIPEGVSMLVATPGIVADYIRNIPPGNTESLQQLRTDLAAEYNAEKCCPITSGIFLRIVAEAAWEDLKAGKPIDEITPFWRMIDSKSPTAKKLTFGTDFVKELRKKEGLNW